MNNAKIFNGALSGAMATLLQNRLGVPSFGTVVATANAYATAVDAGIPTIAGDGATSGQQELIDELSRSALNGMYTTSVPTILVNRVIAAFNAGNSSLVPEPGAGGSGGGVDQRVLIVAKSGDDVTGDGTWAKPYLTIQKCMNVVAIRGDASATVRYVVLVLPGNYDDDIYFEPWVFVRGIDHARTVRLNPTFMGLTATWGIAGDKQAGLSGCTLRNLFTIDFNSASSYEGKFYIENCIFNQQPTFRAYSAINQFSLQNCYLLSGLLQEGCNAAIIGCAFQNGGPYRMVSHSTVNTLAAFFGTGCDGGLNMLHNGGDAPVMAELNSSSFSDYDLTGSGCSLTGRPGIFPNVAVSGGAVDPRLNVTGSKGGNVALTSLCTQLGALGAILDSTT